MKMVARFVSALPIWVSAAALCVIAWKIIEIEQSHALLLNYIDMLYVQTEQYTIELDQLRMDLVEQKLIEGMVK
tara:strand:- start:1764 stop:1985 length:222 start_codon:yes stop_codon:yes gene_type:complete